MNGYQVSEIRDQEEDNRELRTASRSQGRKAKIENGKVKMGMLRPCQDPSTARLDAHKPRGGKIGPLRSG
jgi:hypothetical protein